MISLAFDTPPERLKLLAAAMLGLGLFLGDSGTAVAVLTLVAITLTNRELLQATALFVGLAFAADILWLVTSHHRVLTWLFSLLLLAVKAACAYVAYDYAASLDNTGGAGGEAYQPFGRDPFSSSRVQSSSYAPPPPPPPVHQAAAPTPLPQTLPVHQAPPAAAALQGSLL